MDFSSPWGRRRYGLFITRMVVVADGSERADRRLGRVLTTDPGMGVVRHADAGYEKAIETAKTRGVDMPMITKEVETE